MTSECLINLSINMKIRLMVLWVSRIVNLALSTGCFVLHF